MTNEEIIREIKAGIRQKENMYILYCQNITLLKLWTKGYASKMGVDDTLQECYIALDTAVQAFDDNKGYKFTSYLKKAVTTHFIKARMNETGAKLRPGDERLVARYQKINKAHKEENGVNIPKTKAANLLLCSVKDIERIISYFQLADCISLDSPIKGVENENIDLIETITDNTDIISEYEDKDSTKRLPELWRYINDICRKNEKDVIINRYKNNMTLKEIGELNGYSASRAREIEKNGIKRLWTNPALRKWAECYGYYADVAYSYGFNKWKNSGTSAVELAVERKYNHLCTVNNELNSLMAEVEEYDRQHSKPQNGIKHI